MTTMFDYKAKCLVVFQKLTSFRASKRLLGVQVEYMGGHKYPPRSQIGNGKAEGQGTKGTVGSSPDITGVS